MDFSFLSEYKLFFIDGLKYTIMLAFFTVIIGSIFGLLLSLMRLSKNRLLKFIGTAYVEFIRGTPLILQLYIIFYGLPFLGVVLPGFSAGIIALSMNSSAYISEIVRAGIQSVDKGQMEAARSIGMKKPMAMRYIIIPQAIKTILPALGNEFITVIKESSIVSVIGIHDLMYNADTVRGNTFRVFEPLIIAALMYFALTFGLSKILAVFERRMKTSD
ncbi:MAG: amino acid ABC transporter permease [Clostridiaceae bacterium]